MLTKKVSLMIALRWLSAFDKVLICQLTDFCICGCNLLISTVARKGNLVCHTGCYGYMHDFPMTLCKNVFAGLIARYYHFNSKVIKLWA